MSEVQNSQNDSTVMQAINILSHICQSERNCLAQGRFVELAALTGQKAQTLSVLSKILSGPSSQDAKDAFSLPLSKVHKMLKENEAMLKASVLGFKSAVARLDSLKKAEFSLGAYNLHGKSMKMSEPNRNRFLTL